MTGSRRLTDLPRSDPIHFPSSQEIPSSPPSVVSETGTRHKPKRPPPVTPRSFRRFFTPRSALNANNNAGSVRTNRQALRELTSPTLNRLGPAFARSLSGQENGNKSIAATPIDRTPSKKRKFSFSSADSPHQSSPLRKVHLATFIHDDTVVEKTVEDITLPEPAPSPRLKPKRIVRYGPVRPLQRSAALRTSGNLSLRAMTGTMNRLTIKSSCGTDWRDQTSNFYSHPGDLHPCLTVTGDRLTLPFCTASCKTNSLVAVGDEEGGVRLLDSAIDDKKGFSKAYLTFRPHVNAIMDLEFSSDDKLLATASGDQTALIIDMTTQKPVYSLAKHVSSLKRVQFQPASNDKVLATCSRDGNVNIWDLRCKGYDAPALQVRCSISEPEEFLSAPLPKMKFAQTLNSIQGAHAWMSRTTMSERVESQAGRADVTVTSLAFLRPGREHLFVTASEANACVRLWDLRTAYNVRRGRPAPLATTKEPESHVKHRCFGTTSMTLNGDGSRLYTLCRDSTVYAYSTSHLVLGSAPEFAPHSVRPRRSGGPDKEGLGPLYGFRHPRLKVSSFYVKTALRPAMDDHCEMLAVGSSDHCAVLFPTDERFHTSTSLSPRPEDELPNPNCNLARRSLRRTNSGLGGSGRLEDTIPIYQSGTALVGGHQKEVSAVSWTCNGELVSVSDDYSTRCWREGRHARDLRSGGETEGRRWHCGWADTSDSNNDEDE